MKSLTLVLLVMLTSLTVFAEVSGVVKTHVLISDRTTTGALTAITPLGPKRTFHGYGSTTAGSGASTIDVEVSNDGTNWIVFDTLSLTLGTTVTSDSSVIVDPWKYVRGNVKTISGTNAKVSLIMGVQL